MSENSDVQFSAIEVRETAIINQDAQEGGKKKQSKELRSHLTHKLFLWVL